MNAMTLQSSIAQPWTRFLTCVEAYGAQRSAWPLADRVLYDQFATSVAGQDALKPARALDAYLADDTAPVVSDAFLARLQSMPLPPQMRGDNIILMMWKRGVMLVLLMAALGFGNGYAETTHLNQVWSNSTMTTEFGVSIPQ